MKHLKSVVDRNLEISAYKCERTGFKHTHLHLPEGDVAGIIRVGTDIKDDKGLAHITEHCVYLGEKARTGQDLYEAMSGRYFSTNVNATTYNRDTLYEFSAPTTEYFEALAEAHFNMLMNPLFEESSVVPELYVVFNEMVGRCQEGMFFSLLSAVVDKLYGENAYVRNAGGVPEEIAKVTVEEVKAFHREHYHVGNMHLITAGPLNVAKFHEKLEKLLAGAEVRPGLPYLDVMPWQNGFKDKGDVIYCADRLTNARAEMLLYPWDSRDPSYLLKLDAMCDLLTLSPYTFADWQAATLSDADSRCSLYVVESGYTGIPGVFVELSTLKPQSSMSDSWYSFLDSFLALPDEDWESILASRRARMQSAVDMLRTSSQAAVVLCDKLSDRVLLTDAVIDFYEPEVRQAMLDLMSSPQKAKAFLKEQFIDKRPSIVEGKADSAELDVLLLDAELARVDFKNRLSACDATLPDALTHQVAEEHLAEINWPAELPEWHVGKKTVVKDAQFTLTHYKTNNDQISRIWLWYPLANHSVSYLHAVRYGLEALGYVSFETQVPHFSSDAILSQDFSLDILMDEHQNPVVGALHSISFMTESLEETLKAVRQLNTTWTFESERASLREFGDELLSDVVSSSTTTWLQMSGKLLLGEHYKGVEMAGYLEANYLLEYAQTAYQKPEPGLWTSAVRSAFSGKPLICLVSSEEVDDKLIKALRAMVGTPKKQKKVKFDIDTVYGDYDFSELCQDTGVVGMLPTPNIRHPDAWKLKLVGMYLNQLVAREFRSKQGAYTAMMNWESSGALSFILSSVPDLSVAVSAFFNTQWLDLPENKALWDASKVNFLMERMALPSEYERSVIDWDIDLGLLRESGWSHISVDQIKDLSLSEAIDTIRPYWENEEGVPRWALSVIGGSFEDAEVSQELDADPNNA